ncbi:NDxxF motif lipoprotein [Lentibacillus sp. CBA3610]|uniref:NDxxF motif lipoprotein n=1 Tax=Lentibacillus sp. CBA3610 TaxID=2518176 RepID=UPI00159561D2|nr:NDxxF motif lipoprotein [Lentibacillus sp. CBA3610]QKY71186.1 NDxxF motif lipoprotein [Lentibacillus sp. CBA3610]
MRRIFVGFLIIFILSACSQGKDFDTTEEEDDEIIDTEDVEVPGEIFTSEKQNYEIDEEEMKLSIKTYLDSHNELDEASYPFQDAMYEEKELNKNEFEKLARITELTKENDVNFSNYISNNTLPEGYQGESERISQYITAYNALLYEVDEMFNNLMDDANKGEVPKINIKSIMSKTDVVNGREQNKIEAFLDKKNIKTKAFGLGASEE